MVMGRTPEERTQCLIPITSLRNKSASKMPRRKNSNGRDLAVLVLPDHEITHHTENEKHNQCGDSSGLGHSRLLPGPKAWFTILLA
jgi:hypothetical protein